MQSSLPAFRGIILGIEEANAVFENILTGKSRKSSCSLPGSEEKVFRVKGRRTKASQTPE